MTEKTNKDVTNDFLDHIDAHFEEATKGFSKEQKERVDTMVFSILTMIDGEGPLPGFILAPDPHPEDKEYHQKIGQAYYPENHNLNVNCDISGDLHGQWCNRK